MAACANGYLEIVQYFIHESNVNYSLKNNDGQNALHRASFYGQIMIIRYLLKNTKLSLLVKDKRGNNCFHMAAMRINMSCLRYMLKKLTRNKFENEDDSLKLMKQLLYKKNVEGFSPVDYLVKAFNVIRGQETVTEEEVLAYIYDKDQPPKQVIKQVQLEEIQDDMTNLISQRSKNGIKSSLKRISQLDNNSSKNLNDGSPLQQENMNGQYGQELDYVQKEDGGSKNFQTGQFQAKNGQNLQDNYNLSDEDFEDDYQ